MSVKWRARRSGQSRRAVSGPSLELLSPEERQIADLTQRLLELRTQLHRAEAQLRVARMERDAALGTLNDVARAWSRRLRRDTASEMAKAWLARGGLFTARVAAIFVERASTPDSGRPLQRPKVERNLAS